MTFHARTNIFVQTPSQSHLIARSVRITGKQKQKAIITTTNKSHNSNTDFNDYDTNWKNKTISFSTFSDGYICIIWCKFTIKSKRYRHYSILIKVVRRVYIYLTKEKYRAVNERINRKCATIKPILMILGWSNPMSVASNGNISISHQPLPSTFATYNWL